MRPPPGRITVQRLMLEVAFAAALVAPAGYTSRLPTAGLSKPFGWLVTAGWAGMLLLIRWAYRDFRKPFD